MITDKSQTGHETKLVQKFYNDSVDMKTRNERGIEPIMPQVKEIQAISSIEELTKYYTTDEARKLLYFPIAIFTVPDSDDSQRYEVQVAVPSFSLEDPSEYEKLTEGGVRKKQAATLVFTAMLERVGYSKEDAVKMTEDELAKASPKFPFAGMLKLYTDAGVERVSLYDPDW